MCLYALFCFHGVTASGHFLKWHTQLFYIQICICLSHNVTSTIWHNVTPCYSHAGHNGNITDSNSKSSDNRFNGNGSNNSDKSSNSQQCRVAACTSQCSKGVKVWSLLWSEVRALSTSNQLAMNACPTSLSCFNCWSCPFLYVECRYAHVAMHVQPMHVTLGAPWCRSCCLVAHLNCWLG